MNNKRFLLFLPFALGVIPLTSHSAEWAVEGSLLQSILYDDNVFMSENNSEGSLSYTLTPEIVFAHRTDNSEIEAFASYGIQRYFDVDNLDFELQRYGLNATHDVTERVRWGLDFEYSIQPTRNNNRDYLEDFSSTSERTSWSVAPFVSYELTELDTLRFKPSYSEVSFSDDNRSATENQYKFTKLAIDWDRDWTERYFTTTSFSYWLYDNNNTQSSNTFGINVFMRYYLTETWEIFGSIGGRMTEFSGDNTLGFLSEGGVRYRGENLTAQLLGGRKLLPTNQGQLREVDSVEFDLTYLFSERLSSGIASMYRQSDNSVNSNRSLGAIEFYSAGPFVNYELTEDWTLTASYQHRFQNREQFGSSADSNTFMFSINYNWSGMRTAK